MELNPSAKKKLAVLGLALGALAIDRGLIFSGGSEASAGDTPGQTAAAESAPSAKSNASAPKVEVASVLESLRGEVADSEIDRDASRLPELLEPVTEAEAPATLIPDEDPVQAERPTSVDLPDFEVTSIIASSTGSPMAVINGVPVRVGETRQGITLVSVSSRVATIRYADQTVHVRLSE